ncbi:lytic transglycosylase domain-containing protein [Ferruginibacter yonginensis]|uniref:Lytic transglycosylase domain-containing protein n=1 Tax=Ferruginibacter yonginensis TaxID=1310416 RepID=A0ABV8QWN1_9BACT
MLKTIVISTLLCVAVFINGNAQKTIAQDSTLLPLNDTTLEKVEDNIIDEIVETRSVPKKDKVQYFSQLTRYGLKNLFPAYGYNAAMPYSQQVNPNAEKYMQDYLRLHSKYLTNMKSWCLPYFNLIDNIFTQYGLPKELKYLAVIESNLKTTATSWVGAGGPWQFMPYTARQFGLVVNGVTDDRRDYFKSTHAAARYLLMLYKQMHDWLLVIAAYNGGPGRVYSAIQKSGSRNFWALQYYLPEESRNHVKKFIATHYIMEAGGNTNTFNNTGFGMSGSGGSALNPYNNKPTISIEEMEQAETATITGKYSSVVIAKNIAMDIVSFNRYNPLFDNQIAANGRYELILPSDKMTQFITKKYQILNESVQLMLGDADVPDNATVYPSLKTPTGTKKKTKN